ALAELDSQRTHLRVRGRRRNQSARERHETEVARQGRLPGYAGRARAGDRPGSGRDVKVRMNRREFVAALAASLQLKATQLPANKNVKWALSLGLWNHFRPTPFTEVLDVMKDTGFI